jgi:hypothetical protein
VSLIAADLRRVGEEPISAANRVVHAKITTIILGLVFDVFVVEEDETIRGVRSTCQGRKVLDVFRDKKHER